MIILPSAYLPSVEYFAHLVKGECIIDIGEHFIKRSQRNRAQIMTANGVMELTVNVRNANRPRTAMHSIEIDYSKRWQHQHWMAIVSAYKSSPYFDFYADMLEPLYHTQTASLTEFNTAITQLLLKLIGANTTLNISRDYVQASEQDVDLRPKNREGSSFKLEPYIQVFYDRHPFAENLSILDLLLNEGPNSLSVLQASQL